MLYLPEEDAVSAYRVIATDDLVQRPLLESSRLDIRTAARKIKHICSTTTRPSSTDAVSEEGGRHDNDFIDIAQINILPTSDEVVSTELPFLRRAIELDQCINDDEKLGMYVNNHFRLFREDTVRELRDDLQLATNVKKGFRKALHIKDLQLHGIQCTSDYGNSVKQIPWIVQLRVSTILPGMAKLESKVARRKFISENRQLLMHEALASLICDGKVAALVTIHRDEPQLCKKPSIVCVRITGKSNIERALLLLKSAQEISLIQMNTAIFAYEPVLKRLQGIKEIPLVNDIFFWKAGKIPERSMIMSSQSVSRIVLLYKLILFRISRNC